MNVKVAEELSMTSEYAECDGAWCFAAKDLWPGLVQYRDGGAGTTLFKTPSPEELASTALDDLHNYRLFRYLGLAVPTSLEETYKQIGQLSFFPPTHFWLGGKFIDIGEVPEIRVDGHVAFSTLLVFTVLPSDDKCTRIEKFGQLNAWERTLFDKMTAQDQDSLLVQLEKQTPIGEARFKPVQSSVASSWRDARKI